MTIETTHDTPRPTETVSVAAEHTNIVLRAKTALELMTRNPVSICHSETVSVAAAFLMDRGISAAPVIDVAGRPVGVLSRSDIVRHQRETANSRSFGAPVNSCQERAALTHEDVGDGFQVDQSDSCSVMEIMTPCVFSVPMDTPSYLLIDEMVRRGIHRIFVIDAQDILVGVVSAIDILRTLIEPEKEE
jgi:predicted transcriptional regulator